MKNSLGTLSSFACSPYNNIIILFKVGLFTYSSIITNLNQLFTKKIQLLTETIQIYNSGYLQIRQLHLSPSQCLIALLKAATLGSAFIVSQRLFQRRLPLKDNDSIPNFVVRVFGNRHKFFVRKSYFTTFRKSYFTTIQGIAGACPELSCRPEIRRVALLPFLYSVTTLK